MGRLDSKVAIITGAGEGIGRVGAILFAEEGAKAVIACRTAETGEETVTIIKKAGGDAIFVRTDVSKAEDVKNMIKAAVDAYGRLDVLYNNAAIVSEWGALTDWKEQDFEKVIAINVKGVWLGMKYAIPMMIKVGGGSIVNTASTAAFVAQRGSSIYAASKAAVIALSRVAAVEYAPKNIRVNCIAPGPVATQMLTDALKDNPYAIKRIEAETPLGRIGKPEEIAQIALFLASNESSWITGQTLIADGGIEADSHIDAT